MTTMASTNAAPDAAIVPQASGTARRWSSRTPAESESRQASESSAVVARIRPAVSSNSAKRSVAMATTAVTEREATSAQRKSRRPAPADRCHEEQPGLAASERSLRRGDS